MKKNMCIYVPITAWYSNTLLVTGHNEGTAAHNYYILHSTKFPSLLGGQKLADKPKLEKPPIIRCFGS